MRGDPVELEEKIKRAVAALGRGGVVLVERNDELSSSGEPIASRLLVFFFPPFSLLI